MSSPTEPVIESAIRLGVIAAIVYACFLIFRPFLLPVAWAIIIAVAFHPLHLQIVAALGGRSKLALVLFALLGLALLIVPTAMLTVSITDALREGHASYEAGTLRVPPPPATVADLPLIGEQLFETWTSATVNLTATLERYGTEILALASSLLGTAAAAPYFASAASALLILISSTSSLVGDETGAKFLARVGSILLAAAILTVGLPLAAYFSPARRPAA